MLSASAAPTYVSTEWRVRAVTSSSDEQCRSGTGSASQRISNQENRGCCDFLTRSDFILFPRSNCFVTEKIFWRANSVLRLRRRRSGSAITTPFSGRLGRKRRRSKQNSKKRSKPNGNDGPPRNSFRPTKRKQHGFRRRCLCPRTRPSLTRQSPAIFGSFSSK